MRIEIAQRQNTYDLNNFIEDCNQGRNFTLETEIIEGVNRFFLVSK